MKTLDQSLVNREGSALLVALILSIALGISIHFILRSSVTESRLNEFHFLNLEANNAAEGIVDYGVGQLVKRWDAQTSFVDDELAPNKSPLRVFDEIKNFYSDSGVITSDLNLVGGVIPPNAQFYVNPNDPGNRFDPHKGKIVLARNVEVYGKAVANHPTIGDASAYAMQTLQLRDAPLFSHAIFYNMDLEFHPGPTMTINGPVHANGNIWAVAKSDLFFTDTVTTSQNFRVSMMRDPYQGDWSSMPGESGQAGDKVKIKDSEGNWVDPYRGSGAKNNESSYYTSVSTDFGSGYENWREFSSNTWAGNLQTKDHGIPNLNPVGYDDYVPDYTGSGTVANHAYAIIEPNLPVSSAYHKQAGESEKFARKSGLIIRVHRDMNGDGTDDDRNVAIPGQAVRLRSRPDADDGWSSASRQWYAHHTSGSSDPPPPPPDSYDTPFYVSFGSLRRESATEPNSDLVVNTHTLSKTDAYGNAYTVTVDEVIEDPVNMASSFDFDQSDTNQTSFGDLLRAEFDEMFAAHPVVYEKDDGIDYNGDGDKNDLPSGMIDKRIEKAGGASNVAKSRINLIEINTAALARSVESYYGDTFSNYYTPNKYNGVIYVEFPTDNSHTPRTSDSVVKSIDNFGLLVTEGGGSNPYLGKVPDPAFNKNQPNRDRGFTLATNNAMYVRGHFNADGNMGTPSSGGFTGSDDVSDPDPPVALAADAITILSENWSMSNSVNTSPSADHTEFAAAIVCGLIPTNNMGQAVSSGGSHNFPRFLENWGGKKFRYRGSLVALFESEIQNQTWSTGYYSPPQREWGFFAEFQNGNYPPGTPNVRSYRKMDFRFLKQSEYEAKIAALPWNSNP